jgi:hypothetical protein
MSSTTAVVMEFPPCDFCKEDLLTKPARFDGKTIQGPWAFMCGAHFVLYGTGLGLGIGQRLILKGEEQE